jgi:hypothetical protein
LSQERAKRYTWGVPGVRVLRRQTAAATLVPGVEVAVAGGRVGGVWVGGVEVLVLLWVLSVVIVLVSVVAVVLLVALLSVLLMLALMLPEVVVLLAVLGLVAGMSPVV